MKKLKRGDREIALLIEAERKRREDGLEMIPSENHTSPAVLAALGSILNDKYAEGYPGKRYYGGCEIVDDVELLCQERAKKLFNVPFVNVQPYSGSPANHAVHMATLNPGEVVMGLELSSGGHLTHGFKVNFSGKYYQATSYSVNESDGRIDYDAMVKLVEEERPKLIWAGTTAYPLILDWQRFREIADSVDAYLAADISHIAGLVVAGVHPSPTPYAHIITTTTHKTLRGPRGGMIMVTESGIEKDSDLAKKIDKAVFPGLQGGPHQHQIAGIAVSLKEAMSDSFKEYGHQVVKNALVLADELKRLGFNLVSGGTENHLMVIDLRNRGVSGQEVQLLLDRAGITVNKNTVPFDSNPPFNPSGIRLGTPAITTRGMKEKEMIKIASLIDQVIRDEGSCEAVKREVKKLCKQFPIP